MTAARSGARLCRLPRVQVEETVKEDDVEALISGGYRFPAVPESDAPANLDDES
jgi:hypothetical protein